MEASIPLLLSLLLSLYPSSHSISIPRFPTSTTKSFNGFNKASDPQKVPYETKYFTQIVDHFNYNPQSYETFQQRYLIDDRNWGGSQSSSPIFVYTGNEGDIEFFAKNTGFMFDVAPYFKALLVFIEVIHGVFLIVFFSFSFSFLHGLHEF